MSVIFSAQVKSSETVILLHGLARSDRSFTKLASVLNKKGYHTINCNYPSRKYSVGKLAEQAISTALSQCPEASKVHFVTHSMGGILVRQYLSTKVIENLGRVVMLGPPNKGSQVVDSLKHVPGFKLFNGPAGVQLGTEASSVPNKLGSANFDVGIIAGTRSINLLLSTMLPKPDDGKVSVENTKLGGMRDHISLPVTHPFMMKNNKVINQVLYYLNHGHFSR
ncbi:esterase/lipase family protein [Colwellia psychrerythraea]|uniref:Alpha/beta hydrolase n=1 Tax=Colwellia psychrerythraea TaxID=28229 RepID=A0A099KT19_COLPS|nr:acetyltransferase [Colwellia psychrerythraea]KGJ93919.1 hypothetical protein GAB14E_2474 [Colwellia psychrerythraea]